MSSGRCSQQKVNCQGSVASPVANIVGPLSAFDSNWTMVAAEQNVVNQCSRSPVGPQAAAYSNVQKGGEKIIIPYLQHCHNTLLKYSIWNKRLITMVYVLAMV